jgi:hypothetical protein
LISRRYGIVSRRYGIVSRRYGFVSRRYGIVSRRYGIVSRRYGIVSRRYGIVSRRYGLKYGFHCIWGSRHGFPPDMDILNLRGCIMFLFHVRVAREQRGKGFL